jgi:TFIIF-interacting CTD phosphatase-like protein
VQPLGDKNCDRHSQNPKSQSPLQKNQTAIAPLNTQNTTIASQSKNKQRSPYSVTKNISHAD